MGQKISDMIEKNEYDKAMKREEELYEQVLKEVKARDSLTVQKENYTNKNDPCYPQLMSYLKCVEAHTDGLAEGDDCMNETSIYKACRTQHKDWKKQW